jgi:Transposase DDE domain
VIADGSGRAVAFALASGQAHELPPAPGPLDRLPRAPLDGAAIEGWWATGAKRRVASARMRSASRSGAAARGPRSRPGATRPPSPVPAASTTTDRERRSRRVERLWARLKEWRAAATRHEKTAASFLGVLCLAATVDWLKP